MKVSASENAGPAGTADGAGGEGVLELHPGIRDDLPGLRHGRGAAHGGVLVVSEYEDYVGSGDSTDPHTDTQVEAEQESPPC